MKILFVAPYTKFQSASQRFRFEMYFQELNSKNIDFDYKTFWDEKTNAILHQRGYFLKKAWGLVKAMVQRFFLLFSLKQYDFIYVHREATSIGPPFFEWISVKILGKKLIFDFDDALWIPISSSNKLVAKIKWSLKIKTICTLAYRVSAGNQFLADFAGQYCKSVSIIPTIVDTQAGHNELKNQSDKPLTIGWTGTFSNFKFFSLVLPALQKLESKYDFTFLVIADQNPNVDLRSFRFIKWSKESEIDDLKRMNIGLMPLFDDELAKGKCGFKAIQYMSLGIPAVVSPVAVNKSIVDQGINGYHCSTEEEWYMYLEKLILDEDLRRHFGVEARKKVVAHYSIEATQQDFISLFV
jgi:glycosyltransferase involved in cell wall biosynthesis